MSKESAKDRKIREIKEICEIREERRNTYGLEELRAEVRKLESAVLREKQAAMITGILEVEKGLV